MSYRTTMNIFLIYLSLLLQTAIVPQLFASESEPIILWTQEVGMQPMNIKSGDLNGDSRPDVVVSHSEPYIRAIKSDGNVLWDFNTLMWVWQFAVGDINGDGIDDVAAYDYQSPGFLYAIENSGIELWSYDLPVSGTGGDSVDHIKIGDVNGDNKNEVVVGPAASDRLFVFDNKGSILLEYKYGTMPPNYSGITSVELADISGDTTQDIIISYGYECPPCGIRVIDNEGTTIWDFPTSNRLGEAEVGDLNKDGNLDVVVCERPGDTLYAIDNSGSLLWTYTLSDSAHSFGLSLNDVDGDGELNVVVGNATSHELNLLDSKANLIWTFDTGGGIGPIDVGDLNGDGELEIAFSSWPGTVPFEERGIYAIDSNGDLVWFFQSNLESRDLLVKDLNEDGRDEVVALLAESTEGDLQGLNFVYAFSYKEISVDINIYPKVLNLKSKGKTIISGIRLPVDYDPHEIASDSIELSIPSCSDCEVIYPNCGFPLGERHLAFFPRRDLIYEIETMDLELPTKLDLRITGELEDGTPFEGLDTIRIINKQKKWRKRK